MDEMRLLDRDRRSMPLPRPEDLDAAHTRLNAAMGAESAGVGVTPRPRGLRSVKPRAWLIGAVAAAAVTAAAILAPELYGVDASPANADAAWILERAAIAVLDQPFVAPEADQFIYVKDNGTESWSSIDGTHDGLTIQGGESTPEPGCRGGQRDTYKGPQKIGVEQCVPEPRYRTDLPTDTDAMYAYLRQTNFPDSDGFINRLAKDILTLSDHILPPATRAALLRAAGNFPGLTVTPDATVDGQHGIGVSWQNNGVPHLFLFDPETYLPLRHDVIGIVDEVGQRP